MAIHSLHIGNNYPGTSAELYGCVNDARDCEDEWKSLCATSKVLVNSRADRENVFREGAKIKERLQSGDLWLLSISGHGTRYKAAGRWVEAMVFADFELGYDYEVDGWFKNRPKNTFVMAFADCCHSGGFARNANLEDELAKRRVSGEVGPRGIPRTIPYSQTRPHPIDKSNPLFKRDRALRDVIYFSGCETEEYSYDGYFNGRPNGAMTYYLLQAWREFRATGQPFTVRQLYNRLAGRRPKGLLPNADYDQHPIYVASQRNLNRSFQSFKNNGAT